MSQPKDTDSEGIVVNMIYGCGLPWNMMELTREWTKMNTRIRQTFFATFFYTVCNKFITRTDFRKEILCFLLCGSCICTNLWVIIQSSFNL